MSLHFISGKPGGGKSLFAMRLIVDELKRGKRQIVTNVAIRLSELQAYCVGCDVNERVRILDMEECRRFWECRQIGWNVSRVSEQAEKQGKLLDFAKCNSVNGESASAYELGGVMYVIDECHLFFGSRDWATTGRHASWYLTQHRKLGDDVVCITQAVEQVEVAFRRLAEDYTYVANLSKRKLFGFQLPSKFTTGTYLKPFSGSIRDAPLARTVFSLDVNGLGKCYDTAAGFGVVGRVADTNARRTGWPWQVGVGIILFLGLFVWVGASYGARWLGHTGARLISGNPAPAGPTVAPVVADNTNIIVKIIPPPPPPQTKVKEGITPRIVAITGGAAGFPFMVATDDGMVYREGDPELEFVCKSFAVISGRTSRWHRVTTRKP